VLVGLDVVRELPTEEAEQIPEMCVGIGTERVPMGWTRGR